MSWSDGTSFPGGPAPGVPGPGGLVAGGAHYPTAPPETWPAHAPVAPPSPAAWSGGPAPTLEGGGRGGLAAVITVVGVVLVLVLAVVAIGAFDDDGGEETAGSDTTIDLSDPQITAPPSEEPIVPTMPSIPDLLPPGLADGEAGAVPLDDVLPDLIAFVEETRGHPFAAEPTVEAVPAAEFEDLLAAGADEEVEDLSREGVAEVALGLVPPDTDMADIAAEARATGVLGFYDPETTELYVKGDAVTPLVQSVIVHELTHALDDQLVDLSRIDELAERTDESALGFLALVEGSAEYVRTAFVDQMTPEQQEDYALNQAQLGMDQLQAILLPPALTVASQFPYITGGALVQELVAEGGTAAIDAAYEDPPTTSEQVFDVAVFEAREPAVELRPLQADGDVAAEGAFGAVDVALLGVAVDPMAALFDPQLDPVDGFGGGRYVSWTEDDLSCVRVEVVGDDADATDALAARFDEWASAVGGADVGTRTGAGGVEVVTAERCA